MTVLLSKMTTWYNC